MKERKHVYFFGGKITEGNATMKELLGGKGANLAEMSLLEIPVPPGFTITTEVCNDFYKQGKENTIKLLEKEVKEAIEKTENIVGDSKFGDNTNPLLVSVRSGARASMPGMMDTILNLGMNEDTVKAIINRSGNARLAWDSYRRFIQMYGDVVMGLNPIEKDDEDIFEEIIGQLKEEKGIKMDSEFTTDDLKELTVRFKKTIKDKTGQDFPSDPWTQLWNAIMAVFESWMNDRAIFYRKLNNIPEEWGTAVNVQAMVFGNMNDNSGSGVAFTRDSATGENVFNGEYLINAQGEDVVAGIRTPQQITKKGSQDWAALQGISEEDRKTNGPSLEELMPEVFRQLNAFQKKLELHYKDMQDLEFTIQDGKLWLLQTRNGKRTGTAAVKIAVDMLKEGLITEKEAMLRVEPQRIDELLHPVFNPQALKKAKVIAKGLPASPGASSGQIIFFADDAEHIVKEHAGRKLILVRIETSAEDLKGMAVAEGILTARGGMTSHAAVVARGMGKCCVSGVADLRINYKMRTVTANGKTYREGDWISLNGSTGEVYEGQVETKPAEMSKDFASLMELTNKYARLDVRANADTPHDAKVARDFGAVGIGLCRTEHMFFEGDKIIAMREMILAENTEERKKALAKLLPLQQKDFEGIFTVMNGLPVTIRLLDPPLHEFLPRDIKGIEEMVEAMHISESRIKQKINALHEMNPMLGHRGCRLANTYPEIAEMQTRAILQAAIKLKKEGIDTHPEIMVPLTSSIMEMKYQENVIRSTAQKVFTEMGDTIKYEIGSMIEVPRAAITADKIAESAEFFSVGTNDLTQMTYGFSRDDIGKFLPIYLDSGILGVDPFQVIDREGVGELIKMAVSKGRLTRPSLSVGICGEHGGEPSSIEFCHIIGLNYVSCSPYRVPIARLAAAQAAIRFEN
ncbi:pyruvate, phosphate dikinase [Dysgonomonas sp. 216]|uniref:pyruvate, phosphate dikinase n=1 Tax=Dysgonomonas sp. 216 TaxID=2302934 RepID=UPI0013D1F899|nr:pyruvate, phosphate dikinase [Dysgonomonas sp. 216]NDW17459.1 pyruvate, phosphate dikinase [Dysgonomonas sp. 216]